MGEAWPEEEVPSRLPIRRSLLLHARPLCPVAFHDGRVATLPDVVDHYDTQFHLNLSSAQKNDLVEYLKGI